MKKSIVLLAALASVMVKAQHEGSGMQDARGKSISISAGLNYARYYNKNLYNDPYLIVSSKPKVNFDFRYGLMFTPKIGMEIGAVYNQYTVNSHCGGFYKSKVTYADFYGDEYYEGYIAQYDEFIKINAVEIPLMLKLSLGNGKTRFSGNLGLIPGFLAGGSKTESGELTTIGYYPTGYQDVYISVENDSYYGWGKAVKNRTTEPDLQKVFFSVGGGLGFVSDLNDNMFLRMHLFYSTSVGDVTGKDSRGKEYQNVIKEKSPYQKSTLRGGGMNFGIGFYLD